MRFYACNKKVIHGPANRLALLTLCDQALNPPFLAAKLLNEAIFFIQTKFEPCLLYFNKPVTFANSV